MSKHPLEDQEAEASLAKRLRPSDPNAMADMIPDCKMDQENPVEDASPKFCCYQTPFIYAFPTSLAIVKNAHFSMTAHPGSSSLFMTGLFSGRWSTLQIRTEGREIWQRQSCGLASPHTFTSTLYFPTLRPSERQPNAGSSRSGTMMWCYPPSEKYSGQWVMRIIKNTLLPTN